VILREMSASWGATDGPWFMSRWGRENCIVSARSRHCEYPLFQQRLSIKAVWGGREDCFVDGRRVSLDDDTFIILNEGRIYASRLHSRSPVEHVLHLLSPWPRARSARRHAGECGTGARAFPTSRRVRQSNSPKLRGRHDRQITPVLNYIRHHVRLRASPRSHGTRSNCDSSCNGCSSRTRKILRKADLIPAARAATRKELFRRVGLGADFINTHFRRRHRAR